jgi:hypothetical protein
LSERLELFIRKYYLNEVLKGAFLLLFLFLVTFLLAVISEYFGNFSVWVRTLIFYTLLVAWLTVFVQFIAFPFSRLMLGWKRMGKKQASGIISKHFTDIRDQMLNVLELAEMPRRNSVSAEMIAASIDHKISRISPFRFEMAIDRKKTRNILFRMFLAATVFLLVYIFSPQVIQKGTERIINHQVVFAPESPFRFILENDELNVEKGKDFDILLKVEGKMLPAMIYLSYGDARFAMEKVSAGKYRYTLHNVNNPLTFHFKAEEYSSENYLLSVMPAPAIVNFTLEADVPDYTGEKDFTLNQSGDITVPAGTRLTWNFQTDEVSELSLVFNDSITEKPQKEKSVFIHRKRALISSRYSISLKNKHFTKNNVMGYYINVIPDLYPSIRTETMPDSIRPGVYYFRGRISDDYGFSRLQFSYTKSRDSVVTVDVPLAKGVSSQDFYYMFDFSQLVSPGGGIEFFFEVWDNDGVNGPKSARSQKESFTIPTREEVDDYLKNAGNNIEKKMDESSKLSKKIKDDLNKLRQEMLNREMTQFEKTQKLNAIMDQYKQLQNNVNEISNAYQKKNEFLNTFTEQEAGVIEKQRQIEELMENIMDDEMKRMMEELSQLMEQFDKNKLNELTEKMNYNLDDMNRQLDRNLELLKRMEVEEKLSGLSDQLKDLADKQRDLSEETKDHKGDNKDLQEKQKDISDAFKKISEEYKNLQEKNQELSKPVKMPDLEEMTDQVNSEMQQAQENMEQNSNSKASKNQKNAANKMKQMSASLQSAQQSSCSSQPEDMDNLRNIMDNLLKYSFAQEKMMSKVKSVSTRDPGYMDKIREQKELNDNFRVIRDSLYELAKRTPVISSVVNKEIREILQKSDEIVSLLDERQVVPARTQQQLVMTSANNLALLLDEILDQMIQKSQQMQSNSQCNKPGSGNKMSLQQMKSLQSSLKGQMQSMIDQMKGQNPKDGKGNSEQLGRMLAEQEKFRQMLNQMLQTGGLSPESAKSLKEIGQILDEIEKDIIKRNVGQQTLLRQEQILTRLLEAENSEYQRERENKRESRSGQIREYSNPEEIFKYKGLNSPLNETLDENKIKLVRFYNNKYKQYLNTLNE